MVEALGGRIRDGLAQRAVREHDVRIGEEEPLPARTVGASPERVVLAEPPNRELVDAKHQKARVRRLQLAEHVGSGIARAIVDDDDLEPRVVLREKGSERASDRGAFVARGNDDREPRKCDGSPASPEALVWRRAA